MNSGNLLNNLLGATSNIAVPNKNTAAKNRVEASEKFRDALDQARPDVAAPKIRKPEADAARPEATRTRESKEPIAKEPTAKSRQPEKPASKTASAERADTRKEAHPQAKIASDNKPVKTSGTAGEDTETHASSEESSSGDIVDGAGTPDLINPLLQQPPVVADASALLLGNTNGNVDSEVEAAADQASVLLDPLLVAGVNSAAIIQPVQSDPADGINLADAEAGAEADSLLIPAQLATMNQASQRMGSVPQADGTANASQVDTALDQLLVAPAVAGDEPDVTADGSTEIDVAENPDFLTLLNAKTGISKLTESVATTDKAIALDPAKPALASSPLVEPLARLTEAQSPAARSFVAQTGVAVPVGQPQWSQAVGEKVLWLAAQNVSAAEIRLDPPDMGQLHVKVSVNQDQASVTFISPHPVVRDALDQQLNRLREMFSDQGLNLVNVDVSDRSGAQQHQDQERNGHSGTAAITEEEELVPVGATAVTNLRLVDHYA